MGKNRNYERDSSYFLKILLYFILGSIWLRFENLQVLPGVSVVPIGLLFGVLFAHHDHFMIDRKAEFVVLLIAAVLSYASPVGVIIALPY